MRASSQVIRSSSAAKSSFDLTSGHAFTIGRGHSVCQDYALSVAETRTHAVILADGCSSSPDTDIGARFLAKAALSFLYQIDVDKDTRDSFEQYYRHTIQFAALSSRVLKLNPWCLDATLLTIKANSRGFVASIYGDGVAVMMRRDGSLEIMSVEFAQGFPDYLNYQLDAVRRAALGDYVFNHKRVRRMFISHRGNVSETILDSDRSFELYRGNWSDYRWVGILSDGIHSVSGGLDPMDHIAIKLADVLPRLLDLKTLNGDFAQRALESFMTYLVANGWCIQDDLAIGFIAAE